MIALDEVNALGRGLLVDDGPGLLTLGGIGDLGVGLGQLAILHWLRLHARVGSVDTIEPLRLPPGPIITTLVGGGAAVVGAQAEGQ